MAERFLRVYKKLDVGQIKPNLLIYGDLTGSCANCEMMDVKLEMTHCPKCRTEFTHISFRNIAAHFPKIQKIISDRPQLIIVDFEDYRRGLGQAKAQEFLK